MSLIPPEGVDIVGMFPPRMNGQTLATEYLSQLLEGTCEVRRFDMLRYTHDTSRVRRAFGFTCMMRSLRQALRERPGDPVIWGAVSVTRLGHWRDVLTVLPALPAERPVYAVIHRARFDRLFRFPLTRCSARRLVQRLQGVVFQSEELAQRCKDWIPEEKRVVIPNLIGPDVICSENEVRQRIEEGPGKPLRILYLSMMYWPKGYLDVLKAVRVLRQRGLAVEATFAGGWVPRSAEEEFKQRVDTAGLRDVVRVLGPVQDRARVKALHLEADLFVLPTYHPTETQPLAVLEAMNAGTPVIVTAHAGILRLVRHGHEGLFVPSRDPAAIAEAVEQLAVPSTWRTVAEQARQRFVDEFGPEAARRRWEALLARTYS